MWWECLSWPGVSTVLPQTPNKHFLQHSYCCLEGVVQNRWQTMWVALTWRIWHQGTG